MICAQARFDARIPAGNEYVFDQGDVISSCGEAVMFNLAGNLECPICRDSQFRAILHRLAQNDTGDKQHCRTHTYSAIEGDAEDGPVQLASSKSSQ